MSNKAPGHDKISAKVLKLASPVISRPLTTLFNTCVDTSVFPTYCKRAEVTPGFKKGEDTDESNYRPLSVLTATSKVLEDLMLLQISPLNKVLLHKLISAYRPGHSCQDVLLYIVNSLTQALDNGKYAAAVATDLSSAFDCLPPNLMYHKLLAYGFKEDSAKFIHSYLTGRSQRVKIGSVVGDWMDLTKGTPQGSKLGPSLFNLFINDLLYYLPEDSVANFADDNTLYAIDSSPQSLREHLNSLVNKAQLWFTENGMQSNPAKFQSIFFGNTPPCTVSIENISIEPTGLIKLLGVGIDSQLKFSNHITNICIKAGRNLNALKRVAKSLPINVKLLLYKTYIMCHFNFCPLVWHFCSKSDTDKLERLQLRALRFVYADYESDYDALLFKANMPTLELARLRALCTQVFKCVQNLSPKYMCELFVLQDKSIHNTRSAKSIIQNHCNSVNNGLKHLSHIPPICGIISPTTLKTQLIWKPLKPWWTLGWGRSVTATFVSQQLILRNAWSVCGSCYYCVCFARYCYVA